MFFSSSCSVFLDEFDYETNFVVDNKHETVQYFIVRYVFGLLCLVGLICNSIGIHVLRLDKSVDHTSRFWLLNAFATDLIYVIVCGMLMTTHHILMISRSTLAELWLTYGVVCLEPIYWVVLMASVWTTVALVADRYVAVYNRKLVAAARRISARWKLLVVASIWIVSFTFSLPRFFEHTVDSHEDLEFVVRTDMAMSKTYAIVYRISLCSVVVNLLPISLVAFFTHRLHCFVRDNMNNNGRLGSRDQSNNETSVDNGRDVTVTLIVIGVVFIASHVIAFGCSLYTLYVFWVVDHGHNVTLQEVIDYTVQRGYLEIVIHFLHVGSASVKYVIFETANKDRRSCCSRRQVGNRYSSFAVNDPDVSSPVVDTPDIALVVPSHCNV